MNWLVYTNVSYIKYYCILSLCRSVVGLILFAGFLQDKSRAVEERPFE